MSDSLRQTFCRLTDSKRGSSLLAFGAGLLLPLAYAPWSWFPVALLSPALLFYLWLGATPGRAAWLGWLFAAGMFAVGSSWLHISISEYGKASLVVGVLVTAVFLAAMSLYLALAGYLAARLVRADWQALLIVFPSLYVLAEWLRGTLFTGFPWLNLGYSQIESPLRALAPVLGVYGVSWITALIAGLLVLVLRMQGTARWMAALAVLLLLGVQARVTEHPWTQPAGEKISAALVQGNVSQDRKWLPAQQLPTLQLYRRLTEEHADHDLVVWPETAVPAFFHQVDAGYLEGIREFARAQGIDIALGLPVIDRETGDYYNAMLTLGEDERFYFKRHLVPFGEVFPFRDLLGGFYRNVFGVISSFAPGEREQPLPLIAGHAAAFSICYEDAFGEELIRDLPQAAFLINASNDAWFGDSIAPHQHLEIARMRALETGRYLLRATNTGVSAVINPFGELVAVAPQFEEYVVEAEILPMRGATPYVRIGNGWLWLLVIVVGVSLAVTRRPVPPGKPDPG